MSGGTMNGTGSVTVASGIFTWSGGTMADAGTTTIAAGATLAQTGFPVLATGRTLDNAGTAVQGNFSLNTSGAAPLLHNSGTLTKTSGTGAGTDLRPARERRRRPLERGHAQPQRRRHAQRQLRRPRCDRHRLLPRRHEHPQRRRQGARQRDDRRRHPDCPERPDPDPLRPEPHQRRHRQRDRQRQRRQRQRHVVGRDDGRGRHDQYRRRRDGCPDRLPGAREPGARSTTPQLRAAGQLQPEYRARRRCSTTPAPSPRPPASATARSSPPLSNDGVVRANAGTLSLRGGGTHTGSFGGPAATGTVSFLAGTNTFNDGARVLGNVTLAGGTFTFRTARP